MSAPFAGVLKKGKFILQSAIMIHMALFKGLVNYKSFQEKFYSSVCLEERFIIALIFCIKGKGEVEWY